jgi:lysophospholipase L1-like esterase
VEIIALFYLSLQSVFIAWKRIGAKGATLTLFLACLSLGFSGLTFPIFDVDRTSGIICQLIIALTINLIVFLYPKTALLTITQQWSSSTSAKCLAIFLYSTVIPFGIAETAVMALTNSGLMNYFSPMYTVRAAGADDWRRFHITDDSFREVDPVLFWKPIRRFPYNSQRFKGPESVVPKPNGIFRVMTYGDSNTDGPARGAWPEELHKKLQERSGTVNFEVLNAGVAGYSSYQGLLRIREEIDIFTPDLLLVSFGWNDLPTATGKGDKFFVAPTQVLVSIQRVLLKYRLYLVLKYYFAPHLSEQTAVLPSEAQARVPFDDYIDNISAILQLGQERQVPVVLLTRAYRMPTTEILLDSSWRRHAPRYNDALRDLAKTRSATLLEVQDYFEQKGPTFFADECHFTLEGHKEMASFVYAGLTSAGLLP